MDRRLRFRHRARTFKSARATGLAGPSAALEMPRLTAQVLPSGRTEAGERSRATGTSSGGPSRHDKLRTEAPVNGGRNYNGPKVAKFLVGQVKCEPVPAYIGGARTATCGRARVVPREVVSRVEKLTPYRLRLNAKGCDRKRGVVSDRHVDAAKTPAGLMDI